MKGILRRRSEITGYVMQIVLNWFESVSLETKCRWRDVFPIMAAVSHLRLIGEGKCFILLVWRRIYLGLLPPRDPVFIHTEVVVPFLPGNVKSLSLSDSQLLVEKNTNWILHYTNYSVPVRDITKISRSPSTPLQLLLCKFQGLLWLNPIHESRFR